LQAEAGSVPTRSGKKSISYVLFLIVSLGASVRVALVGCLVDRDRDIREIEASLFPIYQDDYINATFIPLEEWVFLVRTDLFTGSLSLSLSLSRPWRSRGRS
jgi:hypothetical protein